MNFKNMPELDWVYGYPVALLVMLLGDLGLYLQFKRVKWL
jgi:magnesium transporter